MRSLVLTSVLAALVLFSTSLAQQQPNPPAIRIGTFDARGVSLAYNRSKAFHEWLAVTRAEYDKAKAAGDEKRTKELETLLRGQSDNAHRQVFGVGPYDSLVDQLKPIFPEVAKSQNVVAIVPKVFYATPGVESIDVTPVILDQLQTDDATRKMITEMNEKIRTGEYKPEEFKGED